jgi:hypothetical protein
MKSKKRSRSGHGGGSASSSSSSALVWTGHDHEDRNQRQLLRKSKKMKKATESGSSALPSSSSSAVVTEPAQLANTNDPHQPELASFAERKRAALTHETKEKKSAMQLRLHWIRTQKKVGALKDRLSAWDPQDEHSIVVGLEECDQADQGNESADDEETPKKRKGRKGPESWKLRGAARPAHEVYDFDVRYVDPHMAALDGAHAKARRTINALAVYKGRVSALLLLSASDEEENATATRDDATLTPRLLSLLRRYLSLLMQYGHLSLELKRYKTAREAWLECVDLEGDPPPSTPADGDATGSHSGAEVPCSVTTAREALVRMDLQQSPPRVESAWKFLSQRAASDKTAWIAYTRALVGCLLQRTDSDALVADAIRSNVYCAYYLAFLDEFRSAVEYTEDLFEADAAPQTDLELALEYCTDELLAKLWQSSGGTKLLRRSISDALAGRHGTLHPADVEINDRLDRLQQELSKREKPRQGPYDTDAAGASSAAPDPPVDVEMYVGMFRTAVEMIQESGQLL